VIPNSCATSGGMSELLSVTTFTKIISSLAG
jgi:hypothetical protein